MPVKFCQLFHITGHEKIENFKKLQAFLSITQGFLHGLSLKSAKFNGNKSFVAGCFGSHHLVGFFLSASPRSIKQRFPSTESHI